MKAIDSGMKIHRGCTFRDHLDRPLGTRVPLPGAPSMRKPLNLRLKLSFVSRSLRGLLDPLRQPAHSTPRLARRSHGQAAHVHGVDMLIRFHFLMIAMALMLATSGCKHATSSTQASVEIPQVAESAAKSGNQPEPQANAAPTALPAGLPKGVDAKDLDASERKVLAEILSEQFCPCGKPRSFAASLDAGDCPLAIKLSAGVVGYLQQGQGKKQVVQALLKDIERLNTVAEIAPGSSPRLGPETAKVVVIEFSDFECPFCRRAAAPLVKLQNHYGFQLFYKFFPLKVHPNAEGAARAAWAAHQQGKFWVLAEAMFTSEPLDWPSVQKLAQAKGLDMKRFLADFAADKSTEAVKADLKAGESAGVDGTPTFYVNGHKAESLAQVQEMVRDALQAAGEKLPAELSYEDLGETAPATRAAAHAAAPTPTGARSAAEVAAPTAPSAPVPAGTKPAAAPVQ